MHRLALKRQGLRIVGGAVLTRKRLREMIESEESARSLVHQLMTVGREVRSTPIDWAYRVKR